MKRWMGSLWMAMLLLAGCAGGSEPNAAEYTIYCRAELSQSAGSDALYALHTTAEGETQARLASDLLRKLIAAAGDGYDSPVPEGTKIRNIRVENGLALVNFSAEYEMLSGAELTLADACITLTLCQLTGVERVSILVEGKILPYREKQILSVSDFLVSTDSDEVRRVRVHLYFQSEETGELLPETQILQLYEGQTQCAAVLEALWNGPESDGLCSVLPEGLEVLGARVEENVCYVNLPKEFLESAPQSRQAQENVIYSLVKSLCSVSDIQTVQFVVEGEAPGYYGGIDLSAPLR